MRIHKFVFPLLILGIFLGTIYGAQAAGIWSVTGKYTAEGEKIEAQGNNPDEIKGWMTIDSVVSAYHLPLDELYAQFNIPKDFPVSKQLKDIEATAENFSVTNLKEWIKTREDPSSSQPHTSEP